MIIIDVSDNINLSLTLPLRQVGVYTGSAAPIGICGIPAAFIGAPVSDVSLTLTNADGTAMTVPCVKSGNFWTALFAPSFFAAYGFISRGVKVVASVREGDATRTVIVGVGDLDIQPDTADVRRGDPDKTVQCKGDDIYLKTQIIDGVQHYKRMALVYDERVGWAFDRIGDYILVDGEFREVNS